MLLFFCFTCLSYAYFVKDLINNVSYDKKALYAYDMGFSRLSVATIITAYTR